MILTMRLILAGGAFSLVQVQSSLLQIPLSLHITRSLSGRRLPLVMPPLRLLRQVVLPSAQMQAQPLKVLTCARLCLGFGGGPNKKTITKKNANTHQQP